MSIRRRSVFRRSSGIALIDLIMAIAIIAIAVTGMVAAISLSVQHSADPLVEKQALAIAEALLEEVEMMPFMDCMAGQKFDTASGSCIAATKSRGSMTDPFDNVLDYNNFTLASGGADLGNGLVTVPDGYSATVSVAADAESGQGGAYLPAADAVRITVTVSYPGGGSLVLEGYRAKYAPQLTS